MSRCLVSKVVFALLLAAALPQAAGAFDLGEFVHVAPVPKEALGQEQELPLRISADGIKRARVLLADTSGYRVIEMKRSADVFSAVLKFEKLAVLKYQFQLESDDGKLFESGYYYIRQRAGKELETAVAEMQQELDALRGRQRQLENALFSVKKADPQVLAIRKNQEMARALVALNRSEREAAEAGARVEAALHELEAGLSADERAPKMEEARRLLRELGFVPKEQSDAAK